MKNLLRLVLALAFMALATNANAQSRVRPCFQTGTSVTSCQDVTSANPLPVSASVTASISGFTAASTGTPISVTTGGVTGTLPAGAVVVATNVGTTNGAYCKLGASSTTSDQFISPNGGWFAFTVGASTQLTCITSTSTTTVNMVGGAGLPTGTGGGGGSGSGGVVTQPTASLLNVTEASAASILSAIQSPLVGVTTAQTSAAASSLVAKASAGSVVSISGAAVSGSFIMLFNATTAPADGAVTPLKCWGPMAAAGPFSLAWGVGPVLTMSTGITVVSSSTGCFTKTATNAAFLSVEYQ